MSIHLNEFCNMLLGEKLIGPYRDLDEICFDFGNPADSASGKTLRIHSTAFRVRGNGKVLLSTHDFRDPISESVEADWSKPDTTLFDVMAKDLLERYHNETVRRVELSEQNDIFIYTDCLCITAFVSDCGNLHDESWRLFSKSPEDAPVLIVNGSGAWLCDEENDVKIG